MEPFSFYTLAGQAAGLYKEKGSKFISLAFPVGSESEVKVHLDAVKKQYFDASHHCYAWMLGVEKKNFRAHDDGEPNHSAGDPILGQIRSKNLTNVLVVVIRYFGGVKLGVGGLITAYKSAAEDALNKAAIIEREIVEEFILSYDYSATPEIMRVIKEFNLHVLSQDFNSTCQIRLSVNLKNKLKLFDKISLLNALGTSVKYTTHQ